MVVSGAVASTVKELSAGDSSTLPAPSIARTLKVCGPSVSWAEVYGEEQDANASASTLHSNVGRLRSS